jgi:hypothetical protein
LITDPSETFSTISLAGPELQVSDQGAGSIQGETWR